MTANTAYLYALSDPRTPNSIRYVGQTICSDEKREKIAAAQRGRVVPQWKWDMISRSLTGLKQSSETIIKRSAALRVAFAKPEVKERLRARTRRNGLSGVPRGN